jgi:Ca2+-binding EF-hand superfamily protein
LQSYVDLEEYVAGVMHIRALHDDERIKAAFDRLDADGDGKVTKDEIVAYVY